MIVLGGNSTPVYGVQPKAPFRKTVASGGTAEALTATSQQVAGIWVRPLAGNTGAVYLGDSTVTVANGFPLENTDTAIFIPICDPALIYIDADNNDDGVAVMPI